MNRQWLTTPLFFMLLIGMMAIACNTKTEEKAVYYEQFAFLNEEIPAEGRLVKFEKLTETDYSLYLRMNADSIARFKTLLVLDENEISQLKKEGNNIRIKYNEIPNPLTRDTDKVVRYLEPLYEAETK
ncbi:MAG TPA: hypothetical protein VHM26_02435 [Chitinophagaceae bacterium]|jgi:hypothetical protein|nr:hypothetical protein [Chitinophagaceae bacterium]